MVKKVKICFFGNYIPFYNRYSVIREGFKAKGIDFLECQINKNFGSYFGNFIFANILLIKKFLRLDKNFTHMYVWGYRESVFAAFLLSKIFEKRLIFDPVISIYSTRITEKKQVDKFSFKGTLFFLYEKLAFKLPDLILAPTESFRQHFCKIFSLRPNRVSVLPVGAVLEEFNFNLFEKNKSEFRVIYWGNFHPQHGVEYIIRAAKLIEDFKGKVSFRLIGTGFCREELINLCKKLKVSNVTFTGYISNDMLKKEIIKAHVVLGFFGKTPRAGMSIGNKVYEALSYGKPVITEGSEAVCRSFTNKKELYIVKSGNEREISEGIIELYNNSDLRRKIALGGYERLKKDFSEEKIADKVIKLVADL